MVPTNHLAAELGIDRSHLLKRRHVIQKLAQDHLPRSSLTDAETEADEMYQNAGEKGRKHDDPDGDTRVAASTPNGVQCPYA